MTLTHLASDRLTVLPRGGYEYDGLPMRRVTEILDVIAKPQIERIKRESVKSIANAVAQRVLVEVLRGSLTDETSIAIALNDDVKEAAKQWTKDFAKAEAGTRIHAYMAEWLLAGQGNSAGALKAWAALDPLEQRKASQLRDWVRSVSFEPEAIEEPICDPENRVAGTPDLIGMMDYEGERVRAIADWKTGASLWPSYDIQVTGYCDICARDPELETPDIAVLVRPLGDSREFAGEGCETKVLHWMSRHEERNIFNTSNSLLLWQKWMACLKLAE